VGLLEEEISEERRGEREHKMEGEILTEKDPLDKIRSPFSFWSFIFEMEEFLSKDCSMLVRWDWGEGEAVR